MTQRSSLESSRITDRATKRLDPCLFLDGLISLGPEIQRRIRFAGSWKDRVNEGGGKREKEKIVARTLQFLLPSSRNHHPQFRGGLQWRHQEYILEQLPLNGGAPLQPHEKSSTRPIGELRATVRRPIANRWWLRKARRRRGPRS